MSNPHVLFVIDAAHPEKRQALSGWAQKAQAAGYSVDWLLVPPEGLSDSTPAIFETTAFVIEWLPTQNGLKAQVLKALSQSLPPQAIVLSSAYSVLATTVASWMGNPAQLTGFSPLGLMMGRNTLTLAPALQTDLALPEKINGFLKSCELSPAWIQDTPGMVLPRIYAMLANEAAFALLEGVAEAEAIDTAMRLGTNYPLGPLAWADAVGLDEVLAILEHLWHTYREDRYRPCLLLQQHVQAGHLGKHSGQGFYTYSASSASPTSPHIEPERVSS